MICIDRLETTDGKVYRNLYYATNWADLEFAEEYEAYSHLFLIKSGKKYTELELKAEDIKEISLGNNASENGFIIVEEPDGETYFINQEMADNMESQPVNSGIDEQLAAIKDYCQGYFDSVIGPYGLKDQELVVDNLVAMCIGYMQCYLENEPPMNDDESFIAGFAESVKVMCFATERLEKSRGDALLRAPVAQMVSQYLKYTNLHPDLVKIVKKDDDAPL